MQETLLEKNPDLELGIYVVCEPMLGGSRNHAIDAIDELIPDSRVKQFWNEDFIAGDHFKEFRSGRTAWDIYFLYGPEAVWEEMPQPLLLSGFTVIRERTALEEEFILLLEENARANETN